MKAGRSRGQAIHKYKLLSTFQGVLGSGLIVCGVVGTMAVLQENVHAFVPPYFIGGYAVGILQLLAAMIAGCVAKKAAADHICPVKKRRIGCCIYSHYIVSMLTTLACFVGLIFAGVFGVSYESAAHPDLATTNRRVAIAIIFGCICALLSMIMSMYLVCASGRELGGVVTSSYGARMVITLSTGPSDAVSNRDAANAARQPTTSTTGYYVGNGDGRGDGGLSNMGNITGWVQDCRQQDQEEAARHVAELKAQNRLLQRQLRQLRAQQRGLQTHHHHHHHSQQQQSHPHPPTAYQTPPPAYSVAAEDQGVTFEPSAPEIHVDPPRGQPQHPFASPPPAYSRS